MSGRERRLAERYVIGGLMVDINGVQHETLDISQSAVAVVRQTGVNYSRLDQPSRFVAKGKDPLNQPIRSMHFMMQRASIVVFSYEIDVPDWEKVLKAHDVRADMKQLEDVFG